jgi:hypothetical protein
MSRPRARDLAHDHDVELLQVVEQALEPRPIVELGTTDPVVDIDVSLIHRPALALGVGFGVVHLPCDGLVLGVAVAIVGGLAGVDGGFEHGANLNNT